MTLKTALEKMELKHKILIVLFFVFILWFAVDREPFSKRQIVSFQEMEWHGCLQEGNYIITGDIDWETLFLKKQGGPTIYDSARPLPDVDFSKEMLVIASMGQHSTTGYSITITKVVETKKTIIVHYKKRYAHGIVGFMITCPKHTISLPYTEKRIRFGRVWGTYDLLRLSPYIALAIMVLSVISLRRTHGWKKLLAGIILILSGLYFFLSFILFSF